MVAAIRDRVATLLAEAGGNAVTATAARTADSLRHAHDSLLRGRALVAAASSEELVAAEIRSALHALGEVVGAVVVDDVLDRVFSRFCIGK